MTLTSSTRISRTVCEFGPLPPKRSLPNSGGRLENGREGARATGHVLLNLIDRVRAVVRDDELASAVKSN
jgi:hypothetical protein